MALRRSSAAPRAARSCARAAVRAGVSVADRAERSNSSAPSSDSSALTCALTPDWLMCTRTAARVKLASSATATQYSSCLKSITVDSSSYQDYELDFSLRPSEGGVMSEREKAMKPEDITRLFVERAN